MFECSCMALQGQVAVDELGVPFSHGQFCHKESIRMVAVKLFKMLIVTRIHHECHGFELVHGHWL